jgi:hypothetical protein
MYAYNFFFIDLALNAENQFRKQGHLNCGAKGKLFNVDYSLQVCCENQRMKSFIRSEDSSPAKPDPAPWTVLNESSSSYEQLFVPLTEGDIVIPSGLCAIRGFSFLVDGGTDTAGWQFSTSYGSEWSAKCDRVRDRPTCAIYNYTKQHILISTTT